MRLIGRRDFLAGMGLGPGAYLLGSIFKSSLLPQAMGAVDKRKHFFLFTATDGYIENQFTCNARSETDFDLAACLQPLAPYKKDVVLVSKFFNPVDVQQHGNGYAFLSVMPSPGNPLDVPGGVSIDRFVGKQAGARDPFPAVAVGSAGQGFVPGADGLRQPLSTFRGPVSAYQGLFAAADATVRSRNKSVISAITNDIKKMNGRLAGPEKAKLDQYLTSLGDVEQQLNALQDTACAAKVPMPNAALKAGLPTTPGGYIPMRSEELDALMNVTFNAHLCGLTRVTHVSLFGGHPTYEILRDPGDNTVTHDEGGNEDTWGIHELHHRGDDFRITKVNTLLTNKLALWASLLSKTPDPFGGTGSMLDNSLVSYMNDSGGIHHLGQDKYAAIMVGGAGGAIKTGRYLTYPERQYCVSDLFCAWANALDAKTDKFGQPNLCKGPVPGLLS